MSNATALRTKFEAMIDARTLNQATTDLILVDDTTAEGMMIRIGLIKSIEKRFPAITAWINNFYDGEDDDPCWDIDYPEAILLARDSLGI